MARNGAGEVKLPTGGPVSSVRSQYTHRARGGPRGVGKILPGRAPTSGARARRGPLSSLPSRVSVPGCRRPSHGAADRGFPLRKGIRPPGSSREFMAVQSLWEIDRL